MVSSAWTEYFTLVAGVAVGIAGILFVSIQLTRAPWQGNEVVRRFLLETFSELLVPIFIALSVLLPARWQTDWEPLHLWLLTHMALLGLSSITAVWQIVGIAASIFGWSAAVRTTCSICTAWARSDDSRCRKLGVFLPQLLLQVIPLFGTFPLLFLFSVQGNISFVGVLTLWFVFSSMFETWRIFANSSTTKETGGGIPITAIQQTDESATSRVGMPAIPPTQPRDQPREELAGRLRNSFTSVYLTLSSIIQAGAFGYLAFTVATDAGRFSLTQWVLASTTLLFVVAAWNEYMMGATALVWIPRLRDSSIPFALGIAEVSAVILLYTSPIYWFLAASIFSLISLLAYVNMYCSAAKAAYSEGVLKALGWQKQLSVGYCAAGAALFAGAFALALWRHISSHDLLLAAFAVITFIVAAVFLVRGHVYWQTIRKYAKVDDQR